MFRRHFIQRITLGGAGSLASIGVAEAHEHRIVTYRIKGFSCITCAVGLETMLQQEKGVARAKASYPEAQVVIEFDPQLVTDNWLRAFIVDKGFTIDHEERS